MISRSKNLVIRISLYECCYRSARLVSRQTVLASRSGGLFSAVGMWLIEKVSNWFFNSMTSWCSGCQPSEFSQFPSTCWQANLESPWTITLFTPIMQAIPNPFASAAYSAWLQVEPLFNFCCITCRSPVEPIITTPIPEPCMLLLDPSKLINIML